MESLLNYINYELPNLNLQDESRFGDTSSRMQKRNNVFAIAKQC